MKAILSWILPPARLAILGMAACLFQASSAPAVAASEGRPPTFCNPLDLPYRFNSLKGFPMREAADPVIVRFNDEYWLFASKAGGYWHSKDMVKWDIVVPTGLPLENYAPSVVVIKGKMFFTNVRSKAIFTTDDPAGGKWTQVAEFGQYDDPALFVDDDEKVYMFSGCSPKTPIWGVELDPAHGFAEAGKTAGLIALDPLHHGWELRNLQGSDLEIAADKRLSWVEGAWMTKHNGTYYLQYAAPGTVMKEYGDGVYISDRPLGPYRYAPYSPFSYKPSGFIGSAGHSCMYQDDQGRYWHVVTMFVGVRHGWERRLGIFPAGFVANGTEPDEIACNTYLGDYPQYAPGFARDPLADNSPGWMLVSYNKRATASSTLDERHQPELAFDEDVRTWWAAATGDPGEWLSVDLGKPCRIDAVQINFGDEKSVGYDLNKDAFRYMLETSDDGKTWKPLVDRKENTRDAVHEYVQLDRPVTARYVKLTNVHTPGGAVFSVSGLRLFGSGLGKSPEEVDGVSAGRLPNRRLAKVSWTKSPGADFYIVRYGIKPDRLTHNFQVYDGENVTLSGLNTGSEYFATVDAVNDSGLTKGTKVVAVQAEEQQP